MKITEIRIVSIIISFFIDQKKFTYYSISTITGLDQKTLKDWHLQKRKRIRFGSFDQLISGLQNNIFAVFEEFSEFFIEKLANDGIMMECVRKIFESNGRNISMIQKQLLELDIPEQKYLQETIGTANIIEILKSLLSVYKDYFQVSEKSLGAGEVEVAYNSPVYRNKQSKDFENIVPELNYLVLKFPNSYCVGIILSNYVTDALTSPKYYGYKIKEFETQNKLKMLLFFTDVNEETIPFDVQSSLMKEFNFFFEFVREMDLQEISIQGIKFQEKDGFDFLKIANQHRYAQLVFERIMSYLSVISNEIIFLPYLEKLHRNLEQTDQTKIENALNEIFASYKERTSIRNFTFYANEILLKDICRYSYLSRHSIYYERGLVTEQVESFTKQKKKIPLVVEICAPNSLTTCNIIDQCERLLLFTTSHSAYTIMTMLKEKMKNYFLPPNVELCLCHLNPEYMMHQYPKELNGNVDFLVIGYGAGSQINDLTRFVRYAYNWLSENGSLFISVYNKEAIILNKNYINDQRFENSPIYLSDYWTYTLNEHPLLLKKLKAYSPESLKSTYLALFGTKNINISTYPYISALINPSEYSRVILDEIREADKEFGKKGTHGQLIDAVVHKKEFVEKTDIKIRDYLADFNIQYNNYQHTLAPDSKSLKRSLQEKHVPMSNATLLKTVVLQEKNSTPSTVNCWSYTILPYNEMVVYNRMKFELASESLVIKKFNPGTISPLIVFSQRASNQNYDEKIFLQYRDRINTEYVIMSGSSNTESIRISTKDFFKIAANENVIFQNIIE